MDFSVRYILPLSLDVRRHHGGIVGIVSDVTALPDQATCFLVEGDDSATTSVASILSPSTTTDSV